MDYIKKHYTDAELNDPQHLIKTLKKYDKVIAHMSEQMNSFEYPYNAKDLRFITTVEEMVYRKNELTRIFKALIKKTLHEDPIQLLTFK